MMQIQKRIIPLFVLGLCVFGLAYCAAPPVGGQGTPCSNTSDCNADEGLECRARRCVPKLEDRAPIAKLNLRNGTDALVGETVELDGLNSSDPENVPLTYKWKFSKIPEKSKAKLDSATKPTVTFKPDVPGEYFVELIVSDGKLSSKPARTRITAEPRANNQPVANAGDDQNAGLNGKIALDGSQSKDPDGDDITYEWKIQSAPPGSQAKLSNDAAVKTGFTADKLGKFIVALVVIDALGVRSEPDLVSINVLEGHDKEPSLRSITPKDAFFATRVMVKATGDNFFNGSRLVFDNGRTRKVLAAKVTSKTALEAEVDLNGFDAGDYDVTVLNANGKSSKEKQRFKVKDIPSPRVFELTPKFGFIGTKKLTVKVKGEQFLAGQTEITFAQVPLPTRVTSKGTLEFDLSLVSTAEGSYKVQARNPGGRVSAEVEFRVLKQQPKPTLNVLNPPYADENAKLAFSVHGVGFSQGAVIVFNGKEIKTLRVRRDELRAEPQLDLTGIKPGDYPVKVRNIDGGESGIETFRVRSKNPKPTLTRMLPFTLYLDEVVPKVDVFGQEILKGAKLFIGKNEISGKLGSVTWRSDTYMQASVDLTDKTKWSSGDVDAYIVNPNGKRSGNFKLSISYRVPSISNVTPSSWTTKCDTTVEINGLNFIKQSVVRFGTITYKVGDKTYPLELVSDKKLRFSLKASKLSTGTYQVWVENGPNAITQKQNFKVESPTNITPYIDYLRPSAGLAGKTVSVTVQPPFSPSDRYRSIKPGAVVFLNEVPQQTGCQASSLGYCFNVTAQMNLEKMKPGVYKVYIANPCGVKSSITSFTVLPPEPSFITGLTPAFATSATKSKIVVKGVNFTKGHQLLIDGKVVKSKYKTDKEVETEDVFDFSKLTAKSLTVQVKNGNNLDSQVVTLNIVGGRVPRIASVAGNVQTRSPALAGITLKGDGFVVTSGIFINGVRARSRFVSTTELVVTGFDASKLKVGAYTIQVKNGGRVSNVVPLVLLPPPAPFIDYMRPSTIVAGSTVKPVSVTIYGQRFSYPTRPTLTVTGPDGKDYSSKWKPQTFFSSSYMPGTFDVVGLASGQYAFQIKNPSGAVSNKAFFTISPPPPPEATGTSPGSVFRGSTSQPIFVLGRNFSNGDFVIFNNSLTRIPGSLSGNNLSVTLDLSKLKYAGKYPLYVLRCLNKACSQTAKTKVVTLNVDDPPCGSNPGGAVDCAKIVPPAGSEACASKLPAAQQVCRPTCKVDADCTKLLGAPKTASCKAGLCQ